MDHTPTKGRRLLPAVLDDAAAHTPGKVFAAVPLTNNIQDGFLDVTFAEIARMVDFLAWSIEGRFGRGENFETVGYIGVADIRGPVVFLSLLKCGFKILLLSPRNTESTNISLMKQTACVKLLHASELTALVDPIRASEPLFRIEAIPSFEDMLASAPKPYPYQRTFASARDEPAAVLHSSGSTRLPKPITMTHGSFSVLDNEHNLPEIPGRKRRDWTMWSFAGEGRLFTVFPFFHLGGFLMFTVAPIFGNTTIVYAPPFLVPDGTMIRDIMLQQRLRALLLPPSLIDQLVVEPRGLELIKDLDFVAYSGAPMGSATGNMLSQVVDLVSPYGATETYPQPELATDTEDWEWHEFSPYCKHEMELFDSDVGTYELVLTSDESAKDTAAVYHNLPTERGQFRTKDLFLRHPEKHKLFKYYGRKDDIIVLSNGEKFNPVPFELDVQSNPSIKGALVLGNHRPQPALLIEPKSSETTLEALWPLIERSNGLVPGQGRIYQAMVVLGSPEKPFARTGKGTIIRRLTEDAYRPEIEKLYAELQSADNSHGIDEEPLLRREYSAVVISNFLRSVFRKTFPAGADLAEEADFYASGLDSVQTLMIVSSLKRNLKKYSGASCDWITARTVFENSTLKDLGQVLYNFLNGVTVAQPEGQDGEDLLRESLDFLQGFVAKSANLSAPRQPRRFISTVVVIGSTGSLGSRLLAKFLTHHSISRIYCLNRSQDAKERQKSALSMLPNGNQYAPLVDNKAHFLTARLGEPHLGLSEDEYNELLAANIDAIVFNAWKLDFVAAARVFRPFLHGLAEAVRLSVESRQGNGLPPPRILFVGSLASVGSLAATSSAPEAPVMDLSAAAGVGYGQSKLIAERMLVEAGRMFGIPITVVRICQLIGDDVGAAKTDGSWLSAIVTTSTTLKCIPSHVAVVDWVRFGAAADMIRDILMNNSEAGMKEEATDLYHITHPDPQKWEIVVDALRKRLDGASVVPLAEWARRLRAVAEGPEAPDVRALPAILILDFLDWLASAGAEDLRYDTSRAAAASGVRLPRIDGAFLGHWLGD